MEEIFKHRMDIKKNILKSFQIDLEKSEENDIEKARHGVYADNPENRRLKRVGQEYGSKKQEESNGNKSSKNEDNSSKNSKSIEEHAKNTSDEVLKKVLANENAPEDLKNEAKNELAKRQGSSNAESNKKEDNSIKTFSEGSKFFDAYYKITESDLDFEPYIKDINNYIDKHNLGLEGKNQENDFNKLPLSHKTALANLMKKAMGKFTEDSNETFSEGSKFFEAYYEMAESDLDFEPYVKDIENYIEKHNLGLEGKNQENDFDKLPPRHKTALGNLMKKAKNEFAKKKAKSNKKIPKIGEEHPNGKWVWGKLKSGREDWVSKERSYDKKTAVSSLKKMLEDESFASNFAKYEKWGDEEEINEEYKKEFENIKKHFNWKYGESFDWSEEEEAEMYKNEQKSKGFIVVDSGGGTDAYSFLLFKKK